MFVDQWATCVRFSCSNPFEFWCLLVNSFKIVDEIPVKIHLKHIKSSFMLVESCWIMLNPRLCWLYHVFCWITMFVGKLNFSLINWLTHMIWDLISYNFSHRISFFWLVTWQTVSSKILRVNIPHFVAYPLVNIYTTLHNYGKSPCY